MPLVRALISSTTKRATGCAWRAVYLYRGTPSLSSPPPLLYLGIDPTYPRGPRLFGGYHMSRRRLGRFSFSVTLPHLTWGLVWRLRPWLYPLYRAQQRLLHRLDGRYRKAVRP